MTTENTSIKFQTQSDQEEDKDDSSIFDFKQEIAQGVSKSNQRPTTEQSPQVQPGQSQIDDLVKD